MSSSKLFLSLLRIRPIRVHCSHKIHFTAAVNLVSTDEKKYVLTLNRTKTGEDMKHYLHPVACRGIIRVSTLHCKWTGFREGQVVEVEPITVDTELSGVVVTIYRKDDRNLESGWDALLDTIFRNNFRGYALTEGQQGKFRPGCGYRVCSRNKFFHGFDFELDDGTFAHFFISHYMSVINADLDFDKLGIGGLEEEFGLIFRRALASRMFPPELVETLGLKHVKGMLLYGPPGTGKTLIARQIGKILNTREPKIISGPETCSKWYGESEEKIRELFKDAEAEQREAGSKSGLHLIIFDEIDSISRTRGGLSGANDRTVNQLLAKLDGVEQLNNILVIGTTNRRDTIDSALLRPGRLEIQLEIGIPNEEGRRQILSVHTSKMYENNMIADDVDLQELVSRTKNFSGAELAGVVRAAMSMGMNRLIKEKSTGGVELKLEVAKTLKVQRDDFLNAIENDIKPSFGSSVGAIIDTYKDRGIIEWGPPVSNILAKGDLLIEQLRKLSVEKKGGLVSVLLEGSPNSGKTALAAEIAQRTGFPFITICSKKDMFGFSDAETCSRMRQIFEDAYKCELSCVLIDDVEALFIYNAFGPCYSNTIVQALNVTLRKDPPKGRRLLILCMTSMKNVLSAMRVILPAFTRVLHVPDLTSCDQIIRVLAENELFSSQEITQITTKLLDTKICVGIKKLLSLIDTVRLVGVEHRVTTFVEKLKEESGDVN